MSEELTVQPGCRVVLHCAITLKNGTVAENTFDDEPITVVMGDEDVLIKNLQLALYGLKVGDKESLWIDPQNAFGMPDESAIHVMPRSDFPEDMVPEEGQIIEFATPAGQDVVGAVIGVDGDNVTVDFNHPLAGHEIRFDVEILEIQPAHTE